MAKYPIKFPPGLMRNGTRYQAKGRWRDADLVRFLEGAKRPVGGWESVPFDLRTGRDTFTDDNSTAFGDHTPDAGFGGWTVLDVNTGNGVFTLNIQSNALQFTAGTTTGRKAFVLLSDNDMMPATGSVDLWWDVTRPAFNVGQYGLGVSFYLDSTGDFQDSGGSTGDAYDAWPRGVHVVLDQVDENNVRPRLLEFDGTDPGLVQDTTTTLAAFALAAAATIRLGVTVSGASVTIWTEPSGGGQRTTRGSVTLSTDFIASSDLRAGVCGYSISAGNPVQNADTLVMVGEFPAQTTESLRATITWRENTSGAALLGLGSNRKLYAFSQGVMDDITPAGITTGAVDSAITQGTYGQGLYGAFNYGEGDLTQDVLIPAASWQLDTFGDWLIGVLSSDGKIYYWDGDGAAVQVTGSPTGCDAVVVTPERFVVALGADNDPRKVEWSGQEPDLTSADEWNPLLTLSGSKILETPGDIMCGVVGKNETLILTTADLWAMQFIGGTLVYSIINVGSNCGIVSRHAKAFVDSRLIWMGQNGFFQYDGYVQSIPCEVSDYIFNDFNRTQRAKCWSLSLSAFGEVWFFYPSNGSLEPDRYVIYNYREGHWTTGNLTRQAGADRDVFDYPIMVGDNVVYSHEKGSTRSGAGTPFLESGPVELGDGDRVIDLEYFVPDEALASDLDPAVGITSLGSLRAFVFTSLYPTAAETRNGPYTLANPTSVRLSARQIRLRIEEVTAGDWRLGHVRLDGQPGSMR